MFIRKATSALCLTLLILFVGPAFAQRTRMSTGWNLFTTQQDVEMGQTLAQDMERNLNLPRDSFADGYLEAVGHDVAIKAPGYRYPYQFRVFLDPSIQSFALPGGQIYVSSGLVRAMQNEPQLAAILAHQIGHVAARHGTQRVSTAFANRTNIRRNVSVSEAISTLNLRPEPGSLVMRYTPQQEEEADVLAVQMLYDARFDPQQLATVMQRLSTQPRRDFFNDHPAPANRLAAVRREIQRLGPLAANLRGDSTDLRTAQRSLTDERTQPAQLSGNRPEPPASRFVSYRGADFEIRHPENWYVVETGNTVTLAPEGGNVSGTIAYGMLIDTFHPRDRGFAGRNSFTVPNQQERPGTLSDATNQLIEELRRSNPNLRVVHSVQKDLNGYAALETEMNNDSSLGGREVDRLTTVMHNGELHYFLAVAPQVDINRYSPVFDRMMSSVRLY